MKINFFATSRKMPEIRLNLGCGARRVDGWINIDNYDYDARDTSRTGSDYDLKMDIRRLEVMPGTVDMIMLVHVLEHFTRWEAVAMLKHYFKCLRPGGKLVVEMPDLDKCIEWYLAGEKAPHIKTKLGPLNMGYTQFYGNQWDELDYETHRFVWRMQDFLQALRDTGFWIVEGHHNAQFHQPGRDMFVVAGKPNEP